VLELSGVTAGYGAFTALWDVSLRVATGEVTGGGFYDQGKESVAPVLARDPKFGSALWNALTSFTN